MPRDGETLGEVMFRGNMVMKGYLKNNAATEKAFAGGWFHSGDLGVMHPDGYIQLKDRSKDIIISGGENISSIEVEDVLYKHPAGRSSSPWSPSPTRNGARRPAPSSNSSPAHSATADELIAWCRAHLARLQMPAPRRVRRNSEDVDRQDPEIQAARRRERRCDAIWRIDELEDSGLRWEDAVASRSSVGRATWMA